MKLFEKNRTKKLVNKINELKYECTKRGNYGARLHLDNIIYTVQSPNTTMSFKKYNAINKNLKDVYKYLDKDSINKLKYECEKINTLIRDKQTHSKEEETIMKHNADINDLQDIITSIDQQIAQNEEIKEKSLMKDEIAWRKADAQNKALKQKRTLYKKQFDETLKFLENLETCASAREIRQKFTQNIIEKQGVVNTDEFEENIDAMNYVNEQVNEQNDIISQRVFETTSLEDDDPYRKACEERARQQLEENLSNTLVKDKCIIEDKLVNNL